MNASNVPNPGTSHAPRLPSGIHRCAPEVPNRVPLDKGIINSRLHIEFERQVKKTPEWIALHDSHRVYTYQQLNQEAGRIANLVRAALQGSPPTSQTAEQKAVAILTGANVRMIACMVGILKAGTFFVALDPAHPRARNNFILKDSGTTILLTNDEFHPLAEELAAEIKDGGAEADRAGLKIINIEDPSREIPNSQKMQDNPTLANAIACLTYTSGSTGKPKGVITTHTNLLHHAWSVSVNSHYGPGDRHGIPSSLGTGGAIMRIFSILLCGASLFIYNLSEEGVANLPGWMQHHEITAFNSQPTLFRYICNALLELTGLEENVFPQLRLALMGGEPVSASDIELFKRCFPTGVTLRIGGGSNEAVWIAECYLDHDSQIGDYHGLWGYPALDREILIWDEDGNNLPEGETGEIVVKSRFIAPGYWGKVELTREVFLPAPEGDDARLYRTGDLGCLLPGGLLVHKGRMDFMVKVLGYAVQPGEVEAALLSHPEVKHAAVVGRVDRAGENQLVAFAVSSSGTPPIPSDLRAWLAERLPHYMVPARFYFLDEMPRTATGKVDRLALPEDLPSRPELENPYVPPRTPLEKKLVDIWSQVLDVEPVGVKDNFLELGGNSLRAMQVINQVSKMLPVKISLSDLLSTYTIEDFAELIETRFDIETG